MNKHYVSIQDIEHVKLHVWELQQLVEKMEQESNPETTRLRHILDRFRKGNPDEDRV